MMIRRNPFSGYLLCGFAVIGLFANPLHADEVPKELDRDRLAHITVVFASPNSKFEWALLKEDGEKVLPYVAFILADSDSTDREVVRAFIFARENLTQYDCKTLVEPTVSRLMHHNWEVKVYAMNLLVKIGSREDAAPLVELMHDEEKGVRMCASSCLAKLGGKRELLALEIWLRRKDAHKDEAFDEVKKSRDALRTRLEDEEKKAKEKKDDPKAKPVEK